MATQIYYFYWELILQYCLVIPSSVCKMFHRILATSPLHAAQRNIARMIGQGECCKMNPLIPRMLGALLLYNDVYPINEWKVFIKFNNIADFEVSEYIPWNNDHPKVLIYEFYIDGHLHYDTVILSYCYLIGHGIESDVTRCINKTVIIQAYAPFVMYFWINSIPLNRFDITDFKKISDQFIATGFTVNTLVALYEHINKNMVSAAFHAYPVEFIKLVLRCIYNQATTPELFAIVRASKNELNVLLHLADLFIDPVSSAIVGRTGAPLAHLADIVINLIWLQFGHDFVPSYNLFEYFVTRRGVTPVISLILCGSMKGLIYPYFQRLYTSNPDGLRSIMRYANYSSLLYKNSEIMTFIMRSGYVE